MIVKIRIIESVEFDTDTACPKDYGLNEYCSGYSCSDCWAMSLEEGKRNNKIEIMEEK